MSIVFNKHKHKRRHNMKYTRASKMVLNLIAILVMGAACSSGRYIKVEKVPVPDDLHLSRRTNDENLALEMYRRQWLAERAKNRYLEREKMYDDIYKHTSRSMEAVEQMNNLFNNLHGPRSPAPPIVNLQ